MKKIIAGIMLIAAVVLLCVFGVNGGVNAAKEWGADVMASFGSREGQGAAQTRTVPTVAPTTIPTATPTAAPEKATSNANDAVDMTQAVTTEEPAEGTTEAAKKGKGKGKNKDKKGDSDAAVSSTSTSLTKIESTDRWDETGKATNDETRSQFMSMAAQGYESPEEVYQRVDKAWQAAASGASDEELKKLVKSENEASVLRQLVAIDESLKDNPLYQNLRDVYGEYARAYLYGFELYDSVLTDAGKADGAALYSDAVSIPFKANPEDDYLAFLWELANRIARDPLYADMWAQTFDELYMYVYDIESEKWVLMSVGKEVNPLIHDFVTDDKAAMKKLKKGEGQGAWYDLRLRGCTDENGDDVVVIEPESFKSMCVFGMMAANLQYLGTTKDTPAVYWANTRVGVPNEKRYAAKRTDGNKESKTWAKLGFVRKEESPTGAGLCEYEVWVNLTDGRTGIPGEPTVPNTLPPEPVRPDNPYGNPTPTPAPGVTPGVTPPTGNPNTTPTPAPGVTPGTTPGVTPPPTGNPEVTPTPVPQVTPTTPPPTATPIPYKDPADQPEYQPWNQGEVDDQEDEVEDYTSPEEQAATADEWDESQPDDDWTYVAPTQAPAVQPSTPQREEVTDSQYDYQTDNDGSSSDDNTPYFQDEDGYWDAAPGTYSDPEDCNDNGSTQDEVDGAIDDSEGYVYNYSDNNGDPSQDQEEDTAIDNNGAFDGYYDYDF